MSFPSIFAQYFRGSNLAEDHHGRETDDIVFGLGGADRIFGGAGEDFLYGGSGDDRLFGGTGDDYLDGGTGADLLDGGEGFDSVNYHRSTEAVHIDLGLGIARGGEAEGDVLVSIEAVRGSHLGDLLIGDAGDNFICGLGGADDMYGGVGNDTLRGAGDGDYLDGGEGIDTATYWSSTEAVVVDMRTGSGTAGHAEGDTLVSIEIVRGSELYGDTLIAGEDAIAFYGHGGADTLRGGAGDDSLNGGAGDDLVSGGGGRDMLFGEDGADRLEGDAGDDLLTGGRGDDLLFGGAGADSFKFRTGDGADTIADFEAGLDAIVFSDGQTTWRDLATVVDGADTLIHYGEGDVLRIENATAGEVWAAFDFY